MALEKTVKEDKLEVIDGGGEWKVVQVRTATVITEDGAELSRSYHRPVSYTHLTLPTICSV